MTVVSGQIGGIAMVTIAAASWGTWSLFLRPTGLPGSVAAPLVFLLMAVFAAPLALRDPKTPTWDRSAVVWLAAYIVFDALNLVCFFGAIDTTTVALAVLSHYLAPMIVAIAAPHVDGVRVPGAWIAALVALAGLVIVLEPWREPPRGAVLGVALGASSAVCYAGNVFCLRRVAQKLGPSRAMALHALGAGLLLLPFGITAFDRITPSGFAYLAVGAATLGALSGIVYAIGLVRIGSARAAILAFVEPVVAVVCGILAYGEPFSPLSLVGAALILAAGIHVARQKG